MEGCCECVDAKSLGCCPGCLIKLTERCPAVGSFVSKLSAVVADAAAVAVRHWPFGATGVVGARTRLSGGFHPGFC